MSLKDITAKQNMDAPPSSSSAEAYDQIFRLERNLLAASKAKGPFDPSVRRLRTSIRDGYESLILQDLTFCETFEVEQALWRLHYREIEGFRVRIRKLLNSKNCNEETTNGDRSKKRKKDSKREPLLRALTSFKSFLGEASGFFHGLHIKLRLQHGVASWITNTGRLFNEKDVPVELRRCLVTCHRILIYLGDLARYKELYAVMDAASRDWSVAANYYKQAALLWPPSGNPYNQLAVLCTYCGNSLTALYLYCRSLATSTPFATAWDNLILLFEKNKQLLGQGCTSRGESDKKAQYEATLPSNLHGFVIEQDLWSTYTTSRSHSLFILHFVELIRILLTQPSSDELDRVIQANEGQFEQFFAPDLPNISGKMNGNTPLALQVITILIFCMHHLLTQPNLANCDNLLSSSFRVAFKFVSFLLMAGKKEEVPTAYPVAVVFLEWLSNQPNLLKLIQSDDTVSSRFSEFCEEVIALDAFLISRLIAEESRHDSEGTEGDALSRCFGQAQWEDHELLGFTPLTSNHENLDFKMQSPKYGMHDLATFSCWKLRYTDALQRSRNICQEKRLHNVLRQAKNCNQKAVEEEPSGATTPIPSLKEWIDKTFFSTIMGSDLIKTKQLEIRGSKLGNLCCSTPKDNTRNKNSESLLSEGIPGLVIHSTRYEQEDKNSENQEMVTTGIILKFDAVTPTYMKSNRELEEDSCREISSASIVRRTPMHSSIIMVKTCQNNLGERFTPDSSSKIVNRDLFGSGKSNDHIVDGLYKYDPQSIFDRMTHVKPNGFMQSIVDSRLNHSLTSAIRSNATFLRHNGALTWSNKPYQSQNPFVNRISKLRND